MPGLRTSDAMTTSAAGSDTERSLMSSWAVRICRACPEMPNDKMHLPCSTLGSDLNESMVHNKQR